MVRCACAGLLLACCLASPSSAQPVGERGFVVAVVPVLSGNPLDDYVAYLAPEEAFTLYVHAGSLPDGMTRASVCLTGLPQNLTTILTARGPDGSNVPWVWSSPGVLEIDATGACQSLLQGGVIAEIDLQFLGQPTVAVQPCGLTMSYENCSSVAHDLSLEFFEGVILNHTDTGTASPSWGRTKAAYSGFR